MFEKVITDDKCMRILNWMLMHPDEEYTGAMLGAAVGINSGIDFVHRLIVLDECGIVDVDSSSGEFLKISLNKESNIVQHLLIIKKDIEYKILKSEKAVQAVEMFNYDIEYGINDVNMEINDIISQVKNYEELEDEGIEGEVKAKILELKEQDRYDEFLEFLEMLK